jgi:hypothetical protein
MCPTNAWVFATQRRNRAFLCNPKRREMGSHCVGDVARGKVSVVLFGHPSVGMAELFGNDAHRNAAHGQRRAMSMGLIFARLHASSIGRNWCDLPQA